MRQNEERPPAGCDGGAGAVVIALGEPFHPNRRLSFRLGPDGETRTVGGWLALTLALLIRSGARGFTSGEASPLGWARRSSSYVHKLRRLGVPILTQRERAGDATVGRYVLVGAVAVVAAEGEQ